MDLQTFLSLAKNYNHSCETTQIRVVMGNESCDLDSAVSAIAYAYFLYCINKDGSSHPVIPLLNIKREDYHLRTEVTHWLQKHNITDKNLTFRDDIDLQQFVLNGSLDLYLVDHNILPASDDFLEPYVISILDHHALERTSTPVHGMVVEPVGSCCTLVAEAIHDNKPSILNGDLSSLLHGTIILDTVNLSEVAKRATAKDVHMIKLLESTATISSHDRISIFDELTEAKRDISRLNSGQILHKDLKYLSSGNAIIALASVPLLVKEFLHRGDVHASMDEFTKANDVDLLVLLGIDTSEGVERDVALYGHRRRMLDELASYLCGDQASILELSPAIENCEVPNCRLFSQGNKGASRKVILPLVKQWMNTSN